MVESVLTAPRVLLAEDDSFLADLIRQSLVSAGYRTFVARNGAEAVTLADYELPDLIILDVNMPKMNGIQALRRIRRQEAHRKTPVMILTASRDEQSVLSAIHAGATDFLAKPFQADRLLKRVMVHLGRDPEPAPPGTRLI